MALVTTMPMSIRKPMSALMPMGVPGDEQRREGADGRERQAEQDDERVDQRAEQRAPSRGRRAGSATPIDRNRLPNASVCCCATPASSTVTPAGMAPLASSASIGGLDRLGDARPASLVTMSPLMVAAGAPSTRVTVPCESTCSTSATAPRGACRTVPTGSCLERRRPTSRSTCRP